MDGPSVNLLFYKMVNEQFAKKNNKHLKEGLARKDLYLYVYEESYQRMIVRAVRKRK